MTLRWDATPAVAPTPARTRTSPVPRVQGRLRDALRVRDFRIALAGSFTSNIGAWMQTLVIGAFIYERTGSSTAVGLVAFMQLGPLLLLPVVGGALASTMNLRTLLVGAQIEQLVASVVLAVLLLSPDPWLPGIYLCVLAVGIGNALHGPAWMSALPDLVGPSNIPAAVSMNSAQMNAARVVGPAVAGALYPWIGAAGVVATNALTYGFAIVALLLIDLPSAARITGSALRQIGAGFASARRHRSLGRVLIGMTLFSLLCLPFTYQLPTIAARNLDLDINGGAYGLLFAAFGFGAVTGAVSVSALRIFRHREWVIRIGLVSFAALLLTLALLRHPGPAYPVIILLGFAYHAVVTSLNTVLQMEVDPAERGPVLALWVMAFGGVMPLGLLLGGWLADLISISFVLIYGSAVAVLLIAYLWRVPDRGQPVSDTRAP